MKRTISTALALLMTVSMASAAWAEEDAAGSTPDNPVVFDYADIDESVYDGVWVDTELGFDVFIPEDWDVSEITDEMAESGIAFVAGEDEETGGANMVITVTELPEDQAYDLETLGEELAGSMTSAMYADLNGIPAVIFENEDTETSGFAIPIDDEDGSYLVTGVISGPEGGYEEFSPSILNMIMSVSPYEDEEVEDEEAASSVSEAG